MIYSSIKKGRYLYFLAAFVFSFLATSCESAGPIDLRPTSLLLVIKKENGEIFPLTNKLNGVEKPSVYLKLSFESKTNLLSLAIDKYYISVDSYFCNNPDKNVILDTNKVFLDNIDINEIAASYIESGKQNGKIIYPKNESGLYTYFVLLGAYSPAIAGWKRKESGSKIVDYKPYDLTENPDDVCIQIVGRTMIENFKSNVVKINKTLIEEKFNMPIK